MHRNWDPSITIKNNWQNQGYNNYQHEIQRTIEENAEEEIPKFDYNDIEKALKGSGV